MITQVTPPITDLFIGGETVPSAETTTFPTHNPATGEVIAEVAEGRSEDVDRAVKSGQRALDGEWGRMALQDRARVLRRMAVLIAERTDELAALECADAGKPIRDCPAQIAGAAEWFDWFADMALKVRSHVVPGLAGHLNYTLRQPHGVVGCIVPWNYPMGLCGIKVAPALAMGNAVILKPAEQTPLTALALADIGREAGLPAGALNVVPGYGPTAGRAIVEHPGIRMVSFTGSTAVGQDIAARAARTMKKVTLELGGKSPNIVFADADLDAAAATSLFTFCVNQGQLCSAGTRLLVEREAHDTLLEKLVDRARALRVGDPSSPETQLGAIISPEQLERVEGYVATGREEGARLLVGGDRPEVPGCERGWFYTPTIFADVDNSMRIAQEEIFGPVLTVIPFSGDEEAAEIANSVMYGLAAGIWTRDLGRAHRMAAAVDAGLVWVNTMNVLVPGSPYSGFKQSGVGVEGGMEQAESFTQLKSVWVNFDAQAPAL